LCICLWHGIKWEKSKPQSSSAEQNKHVPFVKRGLGEEKFCASKTDAASGGGDDGVPN
jgi:hypothetical protein